MNPPTTTIREYKNILAVDRAAVAAGNDLVPEPALALNDLVISSTRHRSCCTFNYAAREAGLVG
jgi:hypothetical protein